MQYEFGLLSSAHDRTGFSCGEPSLDAYLKTQATQDMRRRLAVCHVLTESGHPAILGYYTLSTTSIALAELPEDLRKQSGRYRLVPGVLLGRLAVALHWQGQGNGDVLLGDALLRVLRLSAETGVVLVVVDALNERAAGFYDRREFRRFEDQLLRLFLPVAKIRDVFPEETLPTTSGSGPG
jgi:GNAT superfamily N-acetyltransferase